MTVFWDVAPYGLVQIDRHFRGTYSMHHQGYESLVNYHRNCMYSALLLLDLGLEKLLGLHTAFNKIQRQNLKITLDAI
jgi:hypothetical protein